MAPHFGSRVSGQEAHDKALRAEKGGAASFGVRVTGAITGNGPVAEAKRATEHGIRVVADSSFTNTKGEEVDALSIDELRDGLAENPTVFDSWYEGELAREDGPRDEALHIFREVEKGIKGAGRREILDEIAALLGETAQSAAQRADLAQAQREQFAQQQEREQENVLLADADRVKALRDRAENIEAVKASGNKSSTDQLIPLDTANQVSKIAEEQGLDIGGGARTTAGTVPSKPEGHTNVSTQQPGSGASPSGTPGDDDLDENDEEKGDDTGDGQREVDLAKATKAELEAYLGDEAVEKIKGTGSDGAVLRDDLVKAARRKMKSEGR